jgi:YesN/AraC family two-component response regulator
MNSAVYKVLIADDEYWTREKFRKMIDWEKYSLEFLEPAVDGEDVLKKICESQPDILITDINMPFIDGVELINLLHEKYPDIVTVIVSGYDDFSYVRDTLIHGAINYLIKPVSKIDLVNTLSRALEIISEKKKTKLEKEETRSRLIKASSMIQDSEFSLLLKEKDAPFSPNITVSNSIDFIGSSFILIKLHNLRDVMKKYEYDLNLFSYTVKRKIKLAFGSREALVFNNIYHPNEFLVFSELNNQEMINAAQRILTELKSETDSPVTIVINEHSYSVDNIRDVYLQTVSILMTRSFSEESLILTTQDGKKDSENCNVRDLFDNQYMNELQRLVESGKKTLATDLVYSGLGFVGNTERRSFIEEKLVTKKIVNILVGTKKSETTSIDLLNNEYITDLVDNVVDMLDLAALRDVFSEIIDMVMEEKNEYSNGSIQEVVSQAVDFIDENYAKNLSLTSLSKQFGVEHSYFSRIFHQQTGENLILYITKKRINKAIDYIQRSNENLTEIAFIVGYDDYAYFSRVFRKITGKSPREYRNEILNRTKSPE